MKRNLYLILFMIAIGFFASCEKDAPLEEEILYSDKKAMEVPIDLVNGETFTTKLIAAQHYEVGEVTVKRDGTVLTITYKITDGYSYMTETHLGVAEKKADLPLNRAGIPQIGRFKYSKHHNPGVTEHEEVVDVGNIKQVYVAAHAVVMYAYGFGCLTLAEIEAKLPENKVGISFNGPPYSMEKSYYNITLTGADWLNGDHLGWCVDNNGKPVNYTTAKLVSSYSSNDALLENIVPIPANLDRLNYLMNKYDYENNFKVTQAAVWMLMNGEYPSKVLPEWLKYGGIELTDEEMAEATALSLEALQKGKGYIPGCGEKIVILIDSGDGKNKQNGFMLIPIPKKPFYKDETAWGSGARFVKSTWAMYNLLNLI